MAIPFPGPAEVEAEAVHRFLRIRPAGPRPRLCGASFHRPGLGGKPAGQGSGPEGFLETCPQYLLLTDQRYQDPDGAKYVMSPPLRKTWDNEALWQGLNSGEINTIGTDHCSFTMAQKAMAPMIFQKFPMAPLGCSIGPSSSTPTAYAPAG